MRFADRTEAGRLLAAQLVGLAGEAPVVLGLPRGGVPVAAEVARALGAPLDVLIVRKLGCPWQPELGVGALGEGGVQLLNTRLMAELGVRESELDETIRREQAVIDERVRAYRAGTDAVPIAGRTAIVVDDGLATGTATTMRPTPRWRSTSMAARAVKPVAPAETLADLRHLADDVVCLEMPRRFQAIGHHYGDFSQTSDDEVTRLLAAADG